MGKLVESSSPSETTPKLDLAEDQNTSPISNQDSNLIKSGAPNNIIVPKSFKNPERYTSPTDKMMSPVTRGILARNRKGRKLLPPSAANQPKIQALQLEELPAMKSPN